MKNNITGKFRVTIKSGPRWFRAMRNHDIKYIDGDTGYNKMFGVFPWGRLKVLHKADEIIFEYDDDIIVDRLKFITDDLLLGRFYMNEKYIGTFIMERIK